MIWHGYGGGWLGALESDGNVGEKDVLDCSQRANNLSHLFCEKRELKERR